MLNTSNFGVFIIIIIMTFVTILTRWAGIFVMSYVPINYRVQQFITAMSGSVLIAIIAPMFIKGDLGAKAALLVTALITIFIKKPLVAILLGLSIAALIRHL